MIFSISLSLPTILFNIIFLQPSYWSSTKPYVCWSLCLMRVFFLFFFFLYFTLCIFLTFQIFLFLSFSLSIIMPLSSFSLSSSVYFLCSSFLFLPLYHNASFLFQSVFIINLYALIILWKSTSPGLPNSLFLISSFALST